jgi:hypothetical protein
MNAYDECFVVVLQWCLFCFVLFCFAVLRIELRALSLNAVPLEPSPQSLCFWGCFSESHAFAQDVY